MVSFLVEGEAADLCSSFMLEVYSSVTKTVLETVTISSTGDVEHSYPSSRRRLEGDGKYSFKSEVDGLLYDRRSEEHGRVLVERSPGSVLDRFELTLDSDLITQGGGSDGGRIARAMARKNSGDGDRSKPSRMIIVRPFSPWDIDKLESSFDDWEQHLPCVPSADKRSLRTATLFLAFFCFSLFLFSVFSMHVSLSASH